MTSDAGNEEELEFEAPRKGSADELLDANAHDPLDPMRHSAAHIMAEAVLDLFPEAKLGIGPAIKDGFYYDFELPRALNPEDLRAVEKRMKKSVRADHRFERREWDPDQGRAMLEAAGQSYKVEILDDLRAAAEEAGAPVPEVTTYPRILKDTAIGFAIIMIVWSMVSLVVAAILDHVDYV